MKIQRAVAIRVSKLLSQHKITQYELAKRMASQSTVKHIMDEEYKSIKFETLLKIADAFAISIQEFLNDEVFNQDKLDY